MCLRGILGSSLRSQAVGEGAEMIRTGQAQAELLRGPEEPPLRGTLCITGKTGKISKVEKH